MLRLPTLILNLTLFGARTPAGFGLVLLTADLLREFFVLK